MTLEVCKLAYARDAVNRFTNQDCEKHPDLLRPWSQHLEAATSILAGHFGVHDFSRAIASDTFRNMNANINCASAFECNPCLAKDDDCTDGSGSSIKLKGHRMFWDADSVELFGSNNCDNWKPVEICKDFTNYEMGFTTIPCANYAYYRLDYTSGFDCTLEGEGKVFVDVPQWLQQAALFIANKQHQVTKIVEAKTGVRDRLSVLDNMISSLIQGHVRGLGLVPIASTC